jgi:hypothetical protein
LPNKKKTDKNMGKKEYYGNHVSKDTQNILCPTKKKTDKNMGKKEYYGYHVYEDTFRGKHNKLKTSISRTTLKSHSLKNTI